MTEIPRLLIHQFMTLLKQSLPDRAKRNLQQFVLVETRDNQLTLSAQHAEGALRYQTTTTHLAPSVFCLPATWLTQAEGQQGTVTVEQKATKIEMRWQNQGIPYTVDCHVVAPAEFPDQPTSWVENTASLLKALDDASHCCKKDNPRYSLSRIQLRGHGEIVASDGRQLLMQRGFTFPWKDDVLVPRMGLFGADLLQKEEKVQIGRTKTHVVLKAGAWTLWLKMDDGGRYPMVEQVFPKKTVSTVHFSPGEAEILLRCVKNLPGGKEEDSLVTVEGNDQVFIRAKDGNKPAVEMLLDQSYCSGKHVRFCTNRLYLHRALQLGLTEIHVEDADTPLLCKDASRKYVWMPVSKNRAIPAGSDVVRIVPDKKAMPVSKPAAKPKKVKREKPAAAAAVVTPSVAEASEAAKAESSNRSSVFSRALTTVLQTVLGRCLMVFGRLLRQRNR